MLTSPSRYPGIRSRILPFPVARLNDMFAINASSNHAGKVRMTSTFTNSDTNTTAPNTKQSQQSIRVDNGNPGVQTNFLFLESYLVFGYQIIRPKRQQKRCTGCIVNGSRIKGPNLIENSLVNHAVVPDQNANLTLGEIGFGRLPRERRISIESP